MEVQSDYTIRVEFGRELSDDLDHIKNKYPNAETFEEKLRLQFEAELHELYQDAGAEEGGVSITGYKLPVTLNLTNEQRAYLQRLDSEARLVDFEQFDNLSLAERVEQLGNVLDQTEMQEKDLLYEVANRLKAFGV